MRTMQQAQGVEFRHLAPWVLRWVIYLLQPIRLYNFVSLPSGMQARFSCAFYPTGGGGGPSSFLVGWVFGPGAKGTNFLLLLPTERWSSFFCLGGWVRWVEPPPPPGGGRPFLGGWVSRSLWVGGSPN